MLLTRVDCHLCEEAATTVSQICDEVGTSWASIDVDSDESLRSQWSDHVPVTFVDEKLHGRWFVDPDRLRNELLYGEARPMASGWRPSPVAK